MSVQLLANDLDGHDEPVDVALFQQNPVIDRVSITVEIPDDQWNALRRLVVSSLVRRGFPYHDAEDVAQDVFIKIALNPANFADKLADLDKNRIYFTKIAFNAYLMRLRAERRRRQREEVYCELSSPQASGGFESEDALELAAAAALTPRQHRYVQAVLVDQRSTAEIASAHGTTERAVRAVLQRAAQRVGEEHLLSAA